MTMYLLDGLGIALAILQKVKLYFFLQSDVKI